MTEETREALKRAMGRLGASDRYESEIRRALRKYPEATVDEVIAILKANRMIDDVRTTENAVSINVGRRAVGAGRIREKLIGRGAPEDHVAAATGKLAEAETGTVATLLATKFPGAAPADRGRAGRFLAGRGFDMDVIEACLENYFGDVE